MDSQRRDEFDPQTLFAVRAGRRSLLGGTAVAVAAAFGANVAPQAFADTAPPAKNSPYPFTAGVASGDPLPDGVVLWTRIAPEPFAPYGGLDQRSRSVSWQVATDEKFHDVVRTGAAHADANYDYTVHVDVRGLKPWREYFYRFRYGSHLSPAGRTKTAPAPGAHLNQLNVAVTSCQNWGSGLYHAWHEIAAERPDLVLFLGDYIYEYQIVAKPYRPLFPDMPDAFDQRTGTLSRYRLQHALYKRDPDLQEAHRMAPFAVTWDDHDVENDYVGEYSEKEAHDAFLVRRANAYRAFWEYLPLRKPQRPDGPYARLYRRLTYGDLATFNILDDRQHWSPPLDGNSNAIPESSARRDPSRSILGFEQERWLYDGLGAMGTTWDSLAQGVLFSQLDVGPGKERTFAAGSWASCQAAQQRVIDTVIDKDVNNFVVLSGDIHRNYDLNVLANFDDPTSQVVGVEFAGTSITSGQDGHDTDAGIELRLAENPHMIFGNVQRGFLRCTIDHETWRTDLRVLDRVTTKDYGISTRKSFVTEAGNPGLRDMSGTT